MDTDIGKLDSRRTQQIKNSVTSWPHNELTGHR